MHVGEGPFGTPPQLVHDPDFSSIPNTKELAQRKKYNLSGSVVNSVTGEGLPRALVEANNQIVTMTDANGNFVFEGLAAGTYYLNSRKPGYFSRQEAVMDGPSPAAVEVGAETHSAKIELIPEAVIFGHITDSDGLPVQQLPVQCMRLMVIEGRRQWQPAGSGSTDADGSYRMAGIAPGTYLLVAGPSQFPALGAMAKTAQQNAGYSAAYYPAPSDSGAKTGMTIGAGQKIEADLSVEAEAFYTVSGSMSQPPGVHSWVRLIAANKLGAEQGGGMARRQSGEFRFRMTAPGDYTLEAAAQGEGGFYYTTMPLHVSGDINGLQVALDPAITIPVNFQVQRTQTTTDSDNDASRRLRMQMPAQVMLRSVDQPEHQAVATPRPTEPSIFAVNNVAPGTYKVSIMPFGGTYVASARCGNTDLLQENLVVSQGASRGSIDIVLRDDGGSVKGTITSDGKPSHGILLVVPEHGAPYISPAAPTDSSFHIGELRPGSYSIIAVDSVTDLEYNDPDALESFMSHAAHVDVTANQEASVTVELVKRAEDRGED